MEKHAIADENGCLVLVGLSNRIKLNSSKLGQYQIW